MTDAAEASRQQGGSVAAAATGEPARPFIGRVRELEALLGARPGAGLLAVDAGAQAAGGELEACFPATPAAAQPEAARFLLFDAVGRFLRGVADAGPVLVVLDDLHAADAPSLLLLRFLAQILFTDTLVWSTRPGAASATTRPAAP
jgi:hypothetical protein